MHATPRPLRPPQIPTVNTKPSLAIFDASSTLFSSVMAPINARPSLPSAFRVMPTSILCAYCHSTTTTAQAACGETG